MKPFIKPYLLKSDQVILDAFSLFENNKCTFALVVEEEGKLLGTVSNGEIREALIKNRNIDQLLSEVVNEEHPFLKTSDNFHRVAVLFRTPGTEFLPILNPEGIPVNIMTKEQFHHLLLNDIDYDFSTNFFSLNVENKIYDVVNRPWGFYKSLLFSDFSQAKILNVFPGEEFSLQKHSKREEYWVVVKGKGLMTLGASSYNVEPGQQIFIPKETIHQMRNNEKEGNLIIVEVQMGDYFGEDDIVRIKDKYGRVDE
jgi:mannose-1-phosphate guanylyltransferase / mannose-6-phosphate isomerase